MTQRFNTAQTLEMLRMVIAHTNDERLMLSAWKLLRTYTKGPLFVPRALVPTDPRSERRFRFVAVVALRESGLRVARVAQLTGMSRMTVYRLLDRWQALSEKEQAGYQREIKAYLDRAEDWIEELRAEQFAEMARRPKLDP